MRICAPGPPSLFLIDTTSKATDGALCACARESPARPRARGTAKTVIATNDSNGRFIDVLLGAPAGGALWLRAVDFVDDEHLERCRRFLQLQAELLRQGGEQRTEAERRNGRGD